MFKFGALTGGNHIRSCGMAYVGTRTISVVNDANTDPDSPNKIEDVYLGVDGGGTANATTTAATIITGMRGYSSGTLNSALAFQRRPTPGLRLPHGTVPSPLVNGDMWTTSAGLFVRINGVTKTVTLT
jgi:hypothetical protein